jgi:multiple sugar transport system substrate-binding protein
MFYGKNSRVTSALVALVLGLTLLPIAPSQAATKVTNITYFNWQFAEPGRGTALMANIDQFNATHKTIHVTPITIPYASYATTISTQLGAKSGPDIVNLEYDVFLRLQKAGLLADITTAIRKPAHGFASWDSNFVLDGKRFGVPWQSIGYGLIVNKSLLAKAGVAIPKTFPQFLAAAKALTKGTTQYGFAFRNTMPQESGWWVDLSNWVYGFGGSWTDSKGNPTINTPQVVRAVTEYANFYNLKLVPQGADATTYRQMYWEGKIAMEIDNSAVPTIFSTGNPAIKKDLVVVKTPFPFDRNVQTIIGTAVNTASKNKAADAVFLNWMLLGTSQKTLITAMSAESIATLVQPTKAMLANLPWLKAYAAIAPQGVQAMPQGQELKTAEIRRLVLTQVDRVLRSGITPQAAMDQAQSDVKSMLGM